MIDSTSCNIQHHIANIHQAQICAHIIPFTTKFHFEYFELKGVKDTNVVIVGSIIMHGCVFIQIKSLS